MKITIDRSTQPPILRGMLKLTVATTRRLTAQVGRLFKCWRPPDVEFVFIR